MLKGKNGETCFLLEPQKRSCWLSQPKIQNKQNEDHVQKRWDLYHSDIPEWLQEFKENLVADEIPLQGGSHASSSHEASLEPTAKRREVLGKQCSYSFSLKTEIARSVRRPKLQGPRAEDAMAKPYLVQKILVFWLQQITKFSVKVVNLETIIDMQSWCRTWPPNGSSRIRAKQKLLRKHKGAYVDTTQIGNKWDCWESSAQSERRYICSIVAIRSGWKMVGRFHGMLFLPAKHSRSLVWWENSIRKAVRRIRIWMSSKNDASMILGISMGHETCQIHGQASLSLLHWKKNLQKDICGPGRD